MSSITKISESTLDGLVEAFDIAKGDDLFTRPFHLNKQYEFHTKIQDGAFSKFERDINDQTSLLVFKLKILEAQKSEYNLVLKKFEENEKWYETLKGKIHLVGKPKDDVEKKQLDELREEMQANARESVILTEQVRTMGLNDESWLRNTLFSYAVTLVSVFENFFREFLVDSIIAYENTYRDIGELYESKDECVVAWVKLLGGNSGGLEKYCKAPDELRKENLRNGLTKNILSFQSPGSIRKKYRKYFPWSLEESTASVSYIKKYDLSYAIRDVFLLVQIRNSIVHSRGDTTSSIYEEICEFCIKKGNIDKSQSEGILYPFAVLDSYAPEFVAMQPKVFEYYASVLCYVYRFATDMEEILSSGGCEGAKYDSFSRLPYFSFRAEALE